MTVISLAENCTYTLIEPHQLGVAGLPELNTDVIIEGNGATLERIVFTFPFRFVKASNGASVTIKDLTMQRGRLNEEGGGAILAVEGTKLKLDRVTFLGNVASEGGAVQAFGELTINQSRLRGTKLTNSAVACTVAAP